jgi:PAS domain S-box-containing protein
MDYFTNSSPDRRAHDALLDMAARAARLGGWVVDLELGRVMWSDTVCEIHEEPAGTSPTVEEGLNYYSPESRPHIAALFEACARQGTPFDEELQLLTARGRRVWVRAIGMAVRDDQDRVVRVEGAFQDISDRKAAEMRARDLSERLTHTLESLTDAFFTLDPEWHFTYLNREAERLLMRDRHSLLGCNVWDEFPQAESFEHHYRQAMEHGQTVSFEEYYPPMDRWFEVKAYPSDEGLAVYFRDATERRRAQERLQQTLTELRQRNRELQDFAFVASHDLQEPLRKIRVFSERLVSRHADALGQDVADQLQRIDRAAHRMQSLIDALLDYTRITSRREPFVPVSLDAVCADVIDDLEAAIEAAGARVEIGPLPTLEGDASQLRQLFQNLLSNALKFCHPDRRPHVRVSASPDGAQRWRIRVEDNGIGFEDKYAQKIFSPFQRLHTRDEYEGTGIGLAIVQRIVERHAGEVEATGRPGQGACFVLVLPGRQPKPELR